MLVGYLQQFGIIHGDMLLKNPPPTVQKDQANSILISDTKKSRLPQNIATIWRKPSLIKHRKIGTFKPGRFGAMDRHNVGDEPDSLTELDAEETNS